MKYFIHSCSPDFEADFTRFWYEKTGGNLCDFEMKQPEDDGCPIPDPYFTWEVTFHNDNDASDFVHFIMCHKEHIKREMGGFELALKDWE